MAKKRFYDPKKGRGNIKYAFLDAFRDLVSWRWKWSQPGGSTAPDMPEPIVPGATPGILYGPSGYDSPPNVLPQETELADYTASITVAYGGAGNNLRVFEIQDMAANASLNDEFVRKFDRFDMEVYADLGAAGYTQTLYLFTVKGPSTATFTAGDYNPNSGIKTAIETACSGGMEIKYLPVQCFYPKRDGAGTIRVEGLFDIEMADKLNQFSVEYAKAASQGRSKGVYKLCGALAGTGGSSGTLYLSKHIAYHDANRKVVT